MAYARTRPPLVRQSNQEHCWAAVYDSLSSVEGRMGGHVDQADLLGAPWIRPYLDPGQGLNMRTGFGLLAEHFHMQHQTIAANYVQASMFESALRGSWVVVGYVVRLGVASHVVLAYGVTDTDLSIMDPFRGFITVPFTTVRQSPLKLAFYL
jgi:hypothetical protein